MGRKAKSQKLKTRKHIVIDARGRQSSSGRYVDRLIEHLQKIDNHHRYTILLKPGDVWSPTAGNFTATSCTYKQFSFNILDQYFFTQYLVKLKPDLVHFWMTPQEPVLYRGKRVTTTHDLTMLRFARAGKLPKWLHELRMAAYRWLMKKSLERATFIITPTMYVKRDLAQHYGKAVAQKTVVTHEASEPALSGKAEKPESVSGSFIFAVGTAFPHKNLDRLIQAFEIIHASQPELKLVLAGKREYYYEQLEKFANKSPARKNIIFTGFVSDEELKWLYEHALAYVFPSLSEGFGLPGLEAMAHGCPVVSSDATTLPEVNGNAAHYFDPKDVNDMAQKILDVVTNEKLRQELVKRGRKQIKKFSWENMAKETLAVYKKALKDETIPS